MDKTFNTHITNEVKTVRTENYNRSKEYKKPELIKYGGITELVLMNAGENVSDGSMMGKPLENS